MTEKRYCYCKSAFCMCDGKRRLYKIVDRGADYILIHWNGFEQRCQNAALLGRAITNAESLGAEMDPYDSETARCVNVSLS